MVWCNHWHPRLLGMELELISSLLDQSTHRSFEKKFKQILQLDGLKRQPVCRDSLCLCQLLHERVYFSPATGILGRSPLKHIGLMEARVAGCTTQIPLEPPPQYQLQQQRCLGRHRGPRSLSPS